MPYDLFISYSRRDNQQGRITALKEQIEADYRDFAKEELRCFFDVNDIVSMDDWRHRILEGLRDSNLLLLVLSPAYLDSPYCEWEIVEFLKYEHSRSVGGQGVTPVYFVEIPGLDEPGFEQRAAAWVACVRRRNHVDLRPWFQEGAEALKRADVRHRLDDLERSLHNRLFKLRRLRNSPGNLPAHNPRFVGREAEMQRLHEAAGLGHFGVLTAVQGMGGMGKTALAIQYAYAYADFYPGGRWLVGCAGETTLAAAVRRLDLDLRITLNDAEKRDDTLAARRVLAELERRTIESAQAGFGEKDPPQPKALLLLDNVDHPALLQPPQADLLTGRQWLHVLATTRSGAEDFGNDPERLAVLSIDELPEDDALRLIESYQPGGRFPTQQERDAALVLVKLLGGFTLAVEVVAVHLGERAGRVTCAAFLERMKKEGLGKFDTIIRGTKGGIRHGEKLVGATLKPTLDLLSEQERLVLSYAALLPPDSIPLPWLHALAAKDYPELGRDAGPGYDDPWLNLVNHLLSLRLLQTVDLAEDGRTPRLVRIHRLVQELVRSKVNDAAKRRLDAVIALAFTRSNELANHWHEQEKQWEMLPLVAFAHLLLDNKHSEAVGLATSLGEWLVCFDISPSVERLIGRTLEQQEADSETEPTEIAITLSNLGYLFTEQGRFGEAESLLRKALAIDEKHREPTHPFIAIRLNTLSRLLLATNRLAEVEPLLRRALTIVEISYGPEHPDVGPCVFSLARFLRDTNRLAEAEPLYRRALAICERSYGPEHPHIASCLNNLATLLQAANRLADAEPLMLRALTIREKSCGTEHPDVATSLNSLATMLQDTNRLAEAEPLLQRSLAIREKTLGVQHPLTANARVNLGRLLLDLDRVQEAEILAKDAIEIWRQGETPNDPRRGKAHRILGAIEARRKNHNLAKEHLDEALRLLNLNSGVYSLEIAAAETVLASLGS